MVCRNLPFKISSDEMYDIFGKYGPIRQIRLGSKNDTRGTAFVVYEDILDAKSACDHLSGFNVGGRSASFFLSFLSFSQISIPPFLSSFFLLYRYLIVLYYQPNKMNKKVNVAKKEEDLQKMKEKYGLKEDK